MKRFSFGIVLLVILLLAASSMMLVACKENTPTGDDNTQQPETPTDGLTPQQQVDIAIASLSAMRDACLADNTASASAMSLAPANSDSANTTDLEDLFAMLDRNQSAFIDGADPRRNPSWAVISLVLLDALQQHGTDCLDYDITPTYTFTGGDSLLAQDMKELFPTKIRFLGTMEEDGKNVIYASAFLSIKDVGSTLDFWLDLKTYYVDDAHFGYSLQRAPMILEPEYGNRAGDYFTYYDSAAPHRLLDIEVIKQNGDVLGHISYYQRACHDFTAIAQEDLQLMYDFLDASLAQFPQSDERQPLSSNLCADLDDCVKMMEL